MEPPLVQKIREWTDLLDQGQASYSDKGVSTSKATWSEKRDMGSWTGFLTLDILGKLCFSIDLDASKNAGHVWDRVIPDVMEYIQAVSFIFA